MMPCCDLCYKKYIRANGELDREVYEIVRTAAVTNARKRSNPAYRTPAEQQQLELRLPPLLPDQTPCMCACHISGNDVLH